MYALEFNPKTSDFMPVVYSRWTGTGATTLLGGQNLETQFGAEVYAGRQRQLLQHGDGQHLRRLLGA